MPGPQGPKGAHRGPHRGPAHKGPVARAKGGHKGPGGPQEPREVHKGHAHEGLARKGPARKRPGGPTCEGPHMARQPCTPSPEGTGMSSARGIAIELYQAVFW